MYECKDGFCYFKPKITYIECKNYLVCKHKFLPDESREDGLCIDCYNVFGKWRKRGKEDIIIRAENDICPLCSETDTTTIMRMDCDHYTCIDCFRKIYFGIEIQKPKFTLSLTETNLEDHKIQMDKYNIHKILYKNNLISSKCYQCLETVEVDDKINDI